MIWDVQISIIMFIIANFQKTKSRFKKISNNSKHLSEKICNQNTEGDRDGLMNDDEVLLEDITQEYSNVSDEEETELENQETEIPFTQVIVCV